MMNVIKVYWRTNKCIMASKSASFRDLDVWKKSMDLVELIFHITIQFPQREMYGLAKQMRSAAVSIPSNIAEGSKRRTRTDFCHFVSMAFGSSAELETQLEIAQRLSFCEKERIESAQALLNDIMRMLNRLQLSLK